MLSVIVPIYNGAHVMPKTVPAMLGQDVPAQWIFVDDGSTDQTRSILEGQVADRPLKAGLEVEIHSHPKNRGRAAARNTGIAAAKGSLIVFLDADVAPRPNYLDGLVRLMDQAGVVACVARLEMADPDLSQPYHRYLASSKRGPRQRDSEEPIPWKYFLTTASCVRATELNRIGGFNELISYGEDLELAMRLSQIHPDGFRYAPHAIAQLHDLGTLEKAIANMIEFGRDNLPAMIAEYPALAQWTGVDMVHSTTMKSVHHMATNLLLRPGIEKTVRRLLPRMPSGLSDHAVRYILGYTLATSYQEGLQVLQTS